MDTIAERRRNAGRPTKAEATALDEAILVGARAAFFDKGVAEASMDEIAASIGVTKHTIYRRFPSKAALLDAVIEQQLRALGELIQAPTGGASRPLDDLKTVARRFFDYTISPDSGRLVSLIQRTEGQFSAEMKPKWKRWETMALGPLRERMVAAQVAGDLIPNDPDEATFVLVDMLDGAAKRLRLGNREFFSNITPDAFFEARWSFFTKAMARNRSD